MRRLRPLAALLLAVASLCAPLLIQAQQATLVGDAHVSSMQPTVNAGGLSNLNVGGGYTALVQFDLGVLPAGTTAAQVTRAVLKVYCNRVNTPGTVAVQTVGSAWSEGSVTYATLPTLGATVETGSVSSAGEFVTFDVTATVQSWVSGVAANDGLALSSTGASVQFDSKENIQTGHAPELEIALAVGSAGGGSPGATGATGATGVTGATGATGATGVAGLPGVTGATGVAGDKGATGATGAGVAGATGATGAVGATGLPGATGAAGPQGVIGATGVTGATGPAGAVGATGPQGVAGQGGAQGIPGATGATGLQGPAGAQGVAGPVGLSFQGAYSSTTNYALAAGVMWQGAGYVSLIANNVGNTPSLSPTAWSLFAASGGAGATGATGAAGTNGLNGATGATGASGATGATGVMGATGTAGLVWEGAYSSSTNYAVGDVVSYGGASYVSIAGLNLGQQPSSSPGYWSLLAAQGGSGVQGVVGPTGATGSVGATGAAGPAGAQGIQGATGPQGPAGAQGLQGLAGAQGAIGPTGPQGIAGQGGAQGVAGVTGATGATGAGVAGATGATGPSGATGATGSTGPTGLNFMGVYASNYNYGVGAVVTYQGTSYVSEVVGNLGQTPGLSPSFWQVLAAQGVTGPTGSVGATGGTGGTGLAGAVGATGAVGPTGSTGAAGAVGMNFRSAWTSATNYAVNDAVTFANSTYMAVAANSNAEPDTHPQSWAVLAEAGGAGPTGAAGTAATVAVGSVTTLAAGAQATVTNSGTNSAAVLNFGIPQGAMGATGSGGGTGSTVGGTFTAMYHAVSYSTTYYAVNSPNASASESASVLAWVPLGCTATQLSVYSQQSATITVTLRVGTPGSMTNTALSCQVSTNSSCTSTGSVIVTAGQFVDVTITSASGTAAGVWTGLQCQ